MTALRTIRQRLERWELQHLREHCSDLALRVEDLQRIVERESETADHWRRQCDALIENLKGAAQEVGITVDGQMGAIRPADFTPGTTNAKVAAAMIREAIDFMEGFRDDADQVGVVDIIANLEGLEITLKGGAA